MSLQLAACVQLSNTKSARSISVTKSLFTPVWVPFACSFITLPQWWSSLAMATTKCHFLPKGSSFHIFLLLLCCAESRGSVDERMLPNPQSQQCKVQKGKKSAGSWPVVPMASQTTIIMRPPIKLICITTLPGSANGPWDVVASQQCRLLIPFTPSHPNMKAL